MCYLNQVARGREIIGKPLLEAIPETKGQSAVERLLHEVLETGMPHVEAEAMAMLDRGDGTLEKQYFSRVYQPMRGASGQFDSVLVVAHNVTEAVRARQALQTQQAQLQEMFKQAPAAIALVEGPEHRYVLANALYREIEGGRDVVGKTVAEALPEVKEQGFVGLLDSIRSLQIPFF